MNNIEPAQIDQSPDMTNDIVRFYESSPRYQEIISYRWPQIAKFTFNDDISWYSSSTNTEIIIPIETTLVYSKYDANIKNSSILWYARDMFVPVRDWIYEVEIKVNGTAFGIQWFLWNWYYWLWLIDYTWTLWSTYRQLSDYEWYVYWYSTGWIQTIVNFSFTTRYLIPMVRFNAVTLWALIYKASSSAILTYSWHITINEIDQSFTYPQ